MSRIAIIAPSPIKGSGGVGRIYTFIQALSQAGHECHVYVFDHGGNSPESLSSAANTFYSASGFICHTDLDQLVGQFELALATRWDTATTALKIDAQTRAYLVQDYEVYFNPVGDASISAENSYLLGIHAITYGRWLAWKLQNNFGKTPYYFEFASNTQTFRCHQQMGARLAAPPSIAFVYQDDKPRRCPRLGIEALGIVKHYRPEVKIYFVGSNRKPHLWYEFENVGNLTTTRLNELYNQCHLGLSLSSSNPSCNGFDMMAAGLPSIDLYRENNLLDIPEEGILLAHQTQESIAEAILHLLDNPSELVRRSQYGIEFMKSRSQASEVDTFVAMVHSILTQTPWHGDEHRVQSSVYSAPPVVAKVNRTPAVDAYIKTQYRPIESLRETRDQNSQAYYPTQVSNKSNRQERISSEGQAFNIEHHRHDRLVRRIRAKLGLKDLPNRELFNANYYLDTNPDVAASGMDPFIHFVFYGAAEGRSPSPFFDPKWYASEYSTFLEPGLSPIAHYLLHGSQANLAPNAYFDPIWYSSRYPDIQNRSIHPLYHYVSAGEAEGRDPSERFAASWYLRTNPDVAADGMSPLAHYIQYGHEEGRLGTPPIVARAKSSWEVHSLWYDLKDVSSFDPHSKPEDIEPFVSRPERTILDAPQTRQQLTFDVWSTILHRRCHPDEIKLRSARYLLLIAWSDIRPAFRNHVKMMEARMHAENASAPRGDFEYRFEDAIALWFDNVLSAACDEKKRREFADVLIKHELQAELDVIELDENIAKLIRQLKTAPIYVSDFYMQSQFIKQLLDSKEVGSHFIRGYASCDTYENKRSGTLFKRVLNELEIAPADLTHIGDNPIADLERPRSMGIEAIPYVSFEDEKRNEWYAKAFDNLRGGSPGIHQRRVLALASVKREELRCAGASRDSELYDIGCTIGILAFSFCLNVMQDAISRKAKEVLFFAREGIIFKQIYDELARFQPFNLSAPPSKLLHVSRRATFAASLKSYDNNELMRLWTMYSKQSPAGFAKSLNFDSPLISAAASRAGIELELVVEAPWMNPKFQAFLNDPEFKSYAIESLSIQRALLTQYLEQEISPDQDEVFICDIGWRGTIQDNIASVIMKPTRGHYLALQKFLNVQPQGSTKVAWLSDENGEVTYRLPANPAPFEMIFNGLGGSTIGYAAQRTGDVQPVREIYDAEETVVRSLEPCRSGMMAIVGQLATYIKLHGLVASDLRSLNWKIADEFIHNPPHAIADLFGALEHNETFGVGLVEAMEDAKFNDVIAKVSGAKLHHRLTQWLGTRWPQGMSRQSVVEEWWNAAASEAKRSVPAEILKVHSPALIREVGTRFALYFPEPIPRSGGQRTAINMIKSMVNVGFNAEIYVENMGAKGHVLEEYLGDTRAEIIHGWSAQSRATVAVGTVAHSARYLAATSSAAFNCYLVQDYEALFHPLSSAYLEAERSYAAGLHHITIGNWLSHLLAKRYGTAAQPAGFGIDTQIYRLESDIIRENAICVLHQPEKPWRANELALRALSAVKKKHSETKIYIFGSEEVPFADFDFEHLGVINDPSQLNQLYNRCRIGLCFGLSNPSRIPFEMAAAGCGIIDLYRYNNLMDHLNDVSVLSYQSTDSVAAAVFKLLKEDDLDGSRARLFAKAVAHRTLAWENDALAANIMNVIGDNVPKLENLSPSYTRDAFISGVDESPTASEFCRRQFRETQLKS